MSESQSGRRVLRSEGHHTLLEPSNESVSVG
jgi:hypothetical protein